MNSGKGNVATSTMLDITAHKLCALVAGGPLMMQGENMIKEAIQ